MLILFILLRILRRSLWCFFAGLIVGLIGCAGRLPTLPAIDCLETFLLGPSQPVPPDTALVAVLVLAFFFFFFGILWYAEKYLFLTSQYSFDARVVKTQEWRETLIPQIEREIGAGEFAFPSYAESRTMPPQEYMTRMFIAKKCYADRELRIRLPKLRKSIFHI